MLWLLVPHLDLTLWSLQTNLIFETVATTVRSGFGALVVAMPFQFHALAAAVQFKFRDCGHARSI